MGIMIMIFCFSSQVGSDSKQLSNVFVKLIHFCLPETFFINLSFLVRKFAHFFIYFLLGFFAYSLCKEYTLSFKKIMLLSFFLCFFFAISDEVHQLFVDGRTGRVLDVFIDSFGSLIGILFHGLLNHFSSKKNSKSVGNHDE